MLGLGSCFKNHHNNNIDAELSGLIDTLFYTYILSVLFPHIK